MSDNVRVRSLTLAAVFAALVGLSTLFLKIPGPTGGYYHLGDGVIYACAVLLGPFPAMAAGGIGSMVADIAGGYGAWAPWSLLIKGLTGLVAGRIATGKSWPRDILGMIGGAAVTIVGYGLVAYGYAGLGPAITETFWNFGQTGVGVVIGCALVHLLRRHLNRDRAAGMVRGSTD